MSDNELEQTISDILDQHHLVHHEQIQSTDDTPLNPDGPISEITIEGDVSTILRMFPKEEMDKIFIQLDNMFERYEQCEDGELDY